MDTRGGQYNIPSKQLYSDSDPGGSITETPAGDAPLRRGLNQANRSRHPSKRQDGKGWQKSARPVNY